MAVVAPAGPFDREELVRGLAWLRTRYRLTIRTSIFSRTGYLAGSDARRAEELGDAMERADVAAIVCARGGYGAMRILDRLPWETFAARPKWVIGFSDVTALHLAVNAHGVASVHSPNVTGLGRSIGASERASLLAALEVPDAPARWDGLEILSPGTAEGPLLGGNLALVEAMAAAGRLRLPDGAVLALEDVTERPYRVDRMLTSLRLAGVFARAAAIVLGGFTQCEPGPDGVTIDEVLADRLGDLGIPVVRNAPFGHGAPNHAFVLGRRVRVEGAVARFL